MDIRSGRQRGINYVESGEKYHMDSRKVVHAVAAKAVAQADEVC